MTKCGYYLVELTRLPGGAILARCGGCDGGDSCECAPEEEDP